MSRSPLLDRPKPHGCTWIKVSREEVVKRIPFMAQMGDTHTFKRCLECGNVRAIAAPTPEPDGE